MRILLFLIAALSLAGTARGQDRTTYPEGTRPRVLINWQSFVDEGFPEEWKNPFVNVVINSYTRMNRVIGVDVRPQFWNFTEKFDSDPGEIVISANEKHAESTRLASTFGSFPDRLKIVFHRKRGSDLTPWNWTPFWPNRGEYSMQAVLMHELLHALGLDHSAATKSIMSGGYSWKSHFGPWSGDIDDMRDNYGLRTQNRLRQFATYNGGSSWFTLNNDITHLGHSAARTTHSIAAAGNSFDASYLVGWVSPGNRLTWIRGNGINFDTDTWQIFGGGPEAMFGTALACDEENTYLWAFVDTENDSRKLKVLRSRNDGDTWAYVGFPDASTYGRPGLSTAIVGDRRFWVVIWANHDEDDRDQTGLIYYSVSSDNGSSWSSPELLNGFYRVHDGISIDADSQGEFFVSFIWSGEKDGFEYGQNKVRSMQTRLDPTTSQLSVTRICYQREHSRVSPALAWHESSGRMVQGIRQQNFNTSLGSMQAIPSGCPNNFLHIPSSTTHVAPGMAKNRNWNEVVMWYAAE